MPIIYRRLAVGLGLGFAMCAMIWLFINESSPAYRYLNEDPAAGYGLLVLNLPALFISRLVSGPQPSDVPLYAACFIQWFAIGLAISLLVWRRDADETRGDLR